MSEENKQILQGWFDEVWNNGNSDAIDELFAAEGIGRSARSKSSWSN